MCFSILFLTGNTIFAAPLIGLGYEMTFDYNERTRLMAFSQTVSQFAWMLVPWLWVMIASPELFSNQGEGVRHLSIVVGAICMILGLCLLSFVKKLIKKR